MKLDDDFNLLTYEIISKYGEYGELNISIYSCDNYPLCHLDQIDDTKLVKVVGGYKSYFYYFNKSDWDNDISPISKKQKMLLVNCTKGVTINNVRQCYIYVNMKTDKTIVSFYSFLLVSSPFYTYILKGEENKYLFENILYPNNLYIEIISGNITIETSLNPEEYYENKNKKLYIFTKKKNINIIIKALENSFYLINDNYFDFNLGTQIQPGRNYFTNLIDSTINPYDSLAISENNNNPYLFTIYPLDCEIIVKVKHVIFSEIRYLEKKKGFYQDILNKYERAEYNYQLYPRNYGQTDEPCLCYLSIYKIGNKEGIMLADNIPQSFVFIKKYNKLEFSFPHIEKLNDVNIMIILYDEEEYNTILYLNNIKTKEYMI